MAVYPRTFQPSATDDLIRVGNQYDGGYVLPERLFKHSNGLISFGLNDDWTFEEDFCGKASCGVICFDHTVKGMFWGRRFFANMIKGAIKLNLTQMRRAFRYFAYRKYFDGKTRRHIKQAVGYVETGAVDLQTAIDLGNFEARPFLKVDIEGWEYRILNEISEKADLFSGLAIEFHDVDIHEERISNFIEKTRKNWQLVHFHPNTHTQIGPKGYALAVEMTFIHRDLITPTDRLAELALPIENLDQPNIVGNKHQKIEFS